MAPFCTSVPPPLPKVPPPTRAPVIVTGALLVASPLLPGKWMTPCPVRPPPATVMGRVLSMPAPR